MLLLYAEKVITSKPRNPLMAFENKDVSFKAEDAGDDNEIVDEKSIRGYRMVYC